MRDWSLIDGIIPGAVMIVGALALVFLALGAGVRVPQTGRLSPVK